MGTASAPRAHAAAARARKRSVSSKLVRDKKKGRSLRIDIHLPYLNRDAAAKLAQFEPRQYEPSVKFASALTREVNVKQMQDRAAKLSTDRGEAQGHGPHGDRYPGGLAGRRSRPTTGPSRGWAPKSRAW